MLLDTLKVKNKEEGERILENAFNFLVYLRPGDELIAGSTKFVKLDDDIIHVSTKVSIEEVADTLHKKRIIRFPS